MKINSVLLVLMIALGLSFAGLVGYSLRDTSAREGAAAPEFAITSDSGEHLTTTAFGGKVLVLNFWATWCQPCIQEIPSLNQFQRRFAKDGVKVVAISIDKNPQKYKNFLEHFRVTFDTARDPSADVSSRYGMFQIPESYIIKDGRVMRKFAQGENWVSDDITQYVQSLL